MTFPRQSEIEVPLLRVLVSLGGEAQPRVIYPLVAKYFPDLTDEEQAQRMENTPSARKWWNMVQWARQKLIEKSEIDGSIHGIWKITAGGRLRLQSKSHVGQGSSEPNVRQIAKEVPTAGIALREASSEVNLRDLVIENHEQVKGRLVSELQALSPTAFEKFCTVLLGQLGYDELEVTRRGADGGVDGFGNFRQGVVRIKSAFQAKRWKDGSVGRPEIDRFRGAIQGEFDHGVFLTTSRFTSDAQEASVRKGAITILLLDGNGIAELMIEKGIGVVKQPVYLAEVDGDFFYFDEA